MMRNAQPIRTRLLTAILAGMVSAGFATAAAAAGTASGANAKAGGAQAASPGYIQAAEAHIDAYGSTNAKANAQRPDDATRGADLASDRAGTNSDEQAPSAAAEPAADAKSVAQDKRPPSR
jgi:hypothetical protein